MTSLRHQNYRNENNHTNEITKNTCMIKKTVAGFKHKIMSLFKTNTKKDYSKPRKLKIKKQSEEKIIRAIEDRIIRDIKNLFEQKEQDYYKPVRVSNFYSNNYIKYENNGGRNKTLSIK